MREGAVAGGAGVSPWLVAALTALVMTLFAANSLLCRFALAPGASYQPLDPTIYTALRAISGAGMLWLIQARRGSKPLRRAVGPQHLRCLAIWPVFRGPMCGFLPGRGRWS